MNHKQFYKAGKCFMDRDEHKSMNRGLVKLDRIDHRRVLYQSGRNMSASPNGATKNITATTNTVAPVEKENVSTSNEGANSENPSNENEDKKSARKEKYLKRFKEWKKTKINKSKKKENKPPPFVPIGKINEKPTIVTAKPPASNKKSRESVYEARPSPKIKHKENVAGKVNSLKSRDSIYKLNTGSKNLSTKHTNFSKKAPNNCDNLLSMKISPQPVLSKIKVTNSMKKPSTFYKTSEFKPKLINKKANTSSPKSIGVAKKLSKQKENIPKKHANLAVTLKAKKPTRTFKNIPSNLKFNMKHMLQIPLIIDPALETPANAMQFDPPVTSTHQKLSSHKKPETLNSKKTTNGNNCVFNFFECSNTNDRNNKEKVPGTNKLPKTSDNLKNIPTKEDDNEQQSNWVSSSIAVSRGKDSLNVNQLTNRSSTHISDKNRQTLDTTQKLREKLNQETKRLNELCAKWEAYKSSHITMLEENGGNDMINVAIGQTKLLLSKKFLQFSDLIQRCRAAATNVDVVNNDNEDTKLVMGSDLEGFWVMLELQINNVDERIKNLERWKNNQWMDPDEEKTEKKKIVKKVKKTQSTISNTTKKPGSNRILKLIRQRNAEIYKKESENEENEFASLTPTQNKHRSRNDMQNDSNTPKSSHNKSLNLRHIPVIVRDRKSFSIAPTVLVLPSSASSCRSSSKLTPHILKKNTLLNGRSVTPVRKRLIETFMSTTLSTQKSILKTPGTKTEKPKNVLFDDKSQIRNLNFIGKGTISKEENSPHVNNSNNGSYELRNRKVVLRPLDDTEIPK